MSWRSSFPTLYSTWSVQRTPSYRRDRGVILKELREAEEARKKEAALMESSDEKEQTSSSEEEAVAPVTINIEVEDVGKSRVSRMSRMSRMNRNSRMTGRSSNR